MGRWERSKQLVAASWSVLRTDKELMVLPLISAIASIAVAATFMVPILVSGKGTDAAGQSTFQLGPVSYVLMFAMYVVLAYITVFFKTALLCGADERLRGGDPTLSSALAGAGANAGRILPWAIVSATVSVILRAIQDRSGVVGRIVIGLVGVAWTVVTFLVLPVLVFEKVGVGSAIKRSAELLKRTWGENLIVNAGIGLFALLLSLPAFLLLGLGAATGTALGFGTTAAIAVVWLIGVSCWSSAMGGIFQMALYRYATQAELPAQFATVDLAGAFRRR